MKAPAYYAIRSRTNADLTATFTFIQPNGQPIDVTSWVSSLQIYDDVNGLLLMDVTASGTWTNGGTAGTISGVIRKATWFGIPPGLFRYDYRAVDGNGNDTAWFAGPVINEQGVSLP